MNKEERGRMNFRIQTAATEQEIKRIVEGGQGRTGGELERTAIAWIQVVAACLAIAAVALAVGGYCSGGAR